MAIFGFGKKDDDVKKTPSCCCGTSPAEKADCGCAHAGKTVVKVLGAGCKSCHTMYENAMKAVEGTEIEVQYITDMPTVMTYGIMSMLALVVNEKVVSMGKVLNPDQIKVLLG